MLAIERTREQQVADFYALHHRRVARAVQAAAPERSGSSTADACSIAWLTLVRRDDITLDGRGARWVITVAIHEAWREARHRRTELPSGTFGGEPGPGEPSDPAGPAFDPLERVIELEDHRDRRERFASARPRERDALWLHALGYRYKEITQLTCASYTAVNRRITEGRRRIRSAG